MDIIILTDQEKTVSTFEKVHKRKDMTLTIVPLKDNKNAFSSIEPCQIAYLDLSSMDHNQFIKYKRKLMKIGDIRWGIIDPDGIIDHISSLFHEGFSDYIGFQEYQEGISPKRFEQIIHYRECLLPSSPHKPQEHALSSGDNWDDVVVGNEYSFCIMYISLNNKSQLQQSYGHKYVDNVFNKFEKYCEKRFNNINGRIWKWDETGGLILFPFDGTHCPAIIDAYRLHRDNVLISLENLDAPEILSFSILLHLGNIHYHTRGHTGTTISEAINFIYHAADLKLNEGYIYCTETITNYIPIEIRDLFIKNGSFEGHSFLRMKRMKY